MPHRNMTHKSMLFGSISYTKVGTYECPLRVQCEPKLKARDQYDALKIGDNGLKRA